MTIAEKKQWLERYSNTAMELRRLEAKLEQLRADRYSIASHHTGPVPASSGWTVDPISRMLEKCEAAEMAVKKQMERSLLIREEIEKAIMAMPTASRRDRLLRDVLWYRYVRLFTVETTAEKMHCTPCWVYKLTRQALSEFAVPPEKKA